MRHQSLKWKLIIFFLLVAIVPALLISGINFYETQKMMRSNMDLNNRQTMTQTMEHIEQKMHQVDEFSYWICHASSIQQLLNLPSEETSSFGPLKAEAIRELRLQSSYRPITEYILGLFIIGNNGLDLRDGPEASLVDYALLNLVRQRFANDYWSGVMSNVAHLSDNKNILLYCHPITSQGNQSILGYVMISFSESLILDELNYLTRESNNYALLSTHHGHILGLSGCSGNEVDVLSMFYSSAHPGGHSLTQITDSTTQLTLKGLFSNALINEQTHSLISSTIVLALFAISITLVIAFFLSANLNQPIQHIRQNVSHISQGEFSQLTQMRDSSELGELNNLVIKMSEDIQRLMAEQKRRESEKRMLEMQVLSSQINPHFLYNTLNSIKIMAHMQGLNNIRAMIEALGRLLKANQTITEEWITLREELYLLDNYLYIQNVHFKGKIRYNHTVSDDALLDQLVLKFSLQPLVENSIIHGLSTKPQGGKIEIICDEYAGDLRVRILDDGVGFEAERLAQIQTQLLTGASGETGMRRSHIGIGNVSRRIQIRCGEHYGISICNRPEGGVCTTILLPLEQRRHEDESASSTDR